MPNTKNELAILKKAFARFSEALGLIRDDLDRDGAIQRFEYTFELLWKTLKRRIEFQGLQAASPRETFRIGAKLGLINDPNVWFSFLELRNLASHVYREEYAVKVSAAFPHFKECVEQVIHALEQSK